MNCDTLYTPPSIAERCGRSCDTCAWSMTDEYTCTMMCLNYTIEGERTDYLKDPLENLPCRFHLTPDELKRILDPYFMG